MRIEFLEKNSFDTKGMLLCCKDLRNKHSREKIKFIEFGIILKQLNKVQNLPRLYCPIYTKICSFLSILSIKINW